MGRLQKLLTRRLGQLNLPMVALLCTLGVVGWVYLASGEEIFSPGTLSVQAPRAAAWGGVRSHADLASNCAACHAPAWSGESMAKRCLTCHTTVRDQLTTQGPMHGRLANGLQCSSCHTEHRGAQGVLTRSAALKAFDHGCAAFPLTGAHRQTDCRSCHDGGLYRGTPTTCASCHAEPTVHQGRFGNACASCHSTSTWVTNPAAMSSLKNFDHDLAAFRLIGQHQRIDCRACHKDSSTFLGTAQTCVTCHAEAEKKAHPGRFGVACDRCHSTDTWAFHSTTNTNTTFNHDLTGFKLTGKHQTTDCRSCHTNGTFKGTATSCATCHPEPTVHKGRFSKNCADCHTTHTWAGAEFKHTIFSMTHRGSDNRCAACHNEPSNMKSYTCYNCHQHTPAKEAQRHARRKIVNDLDNCIACHAQGKRVRRASLETEPAELALACGASSPRRELAGCPVSPATCGPGLRPPSPHGCPVGSPESVPAKSTVTSGADRSREYLLLTWLHSLDNHPVRNPPRTAAEKTLISTRTRSQSWDLISLDSPFLKHLPTRVIGQRGNNSW